ncbi:hypothetical protein D3C87_1862750 [compost metagenome]
MDHERVGRENIFRSLAGICNQVNVGTGKSRLVQHIAGCFKSHSQRVFFAAVDAIPAFTAQCSQKSTDINTLFVKMLYEKIVANLFAWMIDINILNSYPGHGSPPVKLVE